MVFKSFVDFLHKYILEPMQYDSGYNVVNTAVVASLFALGVWLLWDRVFKKEKIIIDKGFFVGLLGWLLFGASLRVLEDAGYYNSILFITPIIYIWVGALTILSLLLAQHLEQRYKIRALIFWSGFGYGMAFLNILRIPVQGLEGFSLIVIMMGIWAALLWLIGKKWNFFNFQNSATLWAHLLDGTSSFVGITFFAFWEKHVLGRGLIEFFEARDFLLINGSAAWAIILMKLAVIPLVLYLIDRYGDSDKEKRFYKAVIFSLGLVIGMRNALQVLALA